MGGGGGWRLGGEVKGLRLRRVTSDTCLNISPLILKNHGAQPTFLEALRKTDLRVVRKVRRSSRSTPSDTVLVNHLPALSNKDFFDVHISRDAFRGIHFNIVDRCVRGVRKGHRDKK